MLDQLREALGSSGLNLVGAAPVASYDAGLPAGRRIAAMAPGAVTAIVIGNGGGAFWAVAGAAGSAAADPLDAFTRRTIDRVAVPLVAATVPVLRVLYPFRWPDDPVSFQRLATVAGLGTPSLLGVLVHPEFGPWMALRAALLIGVPMTAARPADGFDPCPTCRERACIAACPAGAVSPAGWDVPRCGAWRARTDDPCAVGCHARIDCVIGREHRYPAAALVHHQAHARPAMVKERA
jgi:hypothetical protein